MRPSVHKLHMMSWMLWKIYVMKANICKQWTKVITVIVSSNKQFCWIYLNYLTLRSKVKVPQRPLWYVTHHLMVMHPHTKYHWPISKDKNVMARTRKYYLKNNYLTLRSRSHGGHYGMWHTALWSCTHIPNIIDLSGKTKKLWSGQASLKRSRSGRKNETNTMSPFVRRGDIITLYIYIWWEFLAYTINIVLCYLFFL